MVDISRIVTGKLNVKADNVRNGNKKKKTTTTMTKKKKKMTMMIMKGKEHYENASFHKKHSDA